MSVVTGQVESLRRLFKSLAELERQSKTSGNPQVDSKLRATADAAVRELEGLDPQAARRLSHKDRKSLKELAELSFLSEEKRHFVLGFSSTASLHLAGVVSDKAKQNVTLAAHAGPMSVQALLAGLKEGQAAAGLPSLTPAEVAARKSDHAMQGALKYLDDLADGSALARMKQAGEHAVEVARKLIASAPATERPAAQAQLAQYQESLKRLDQLGWVVGPQAAGIDRELLEEAIFHKRGLPSRLTEAQKVFIDSADPRAFDPQLFAQSPLAQDMGQALAAGKPADAAALAAEQLGLSGVEMSAVDTHTAEKNLGELKAANRDAWQIINNYREGREKYRANATRTFNEIMGLLHSGMPIEMIIMLVMLLLTERQEEKFNLKIQEMTAFEQLNRMNEPVQRRIDALATSNDPAKLVKIAELENGLAKPEKYGLEAKSTTIVMQELQVEMQMYMQMMQALSAVLRQIQDLILTPVRNIR